MVVRLLLSALLLVGAGCYRFECRRLDFEPRPPTSPEEIRVSTETYPPPPGSYRAVAIVAYGGTTTLPSMEDAVAKFKAKAAALGCDAIVVINPGGDVSRKPEQLSWFNGQPYYTGSSSVTTYAWSAGCLVRNR
jgi:hypothetical protein